VLAAAAGELHGPLIRTSASVIGQRAGESIIFATTSWGFMVTVMLRGMALALALRPRGWLRKTLHFQVAPPHLGDELVDPHHRERLLALEPLHVELGPTSLRFELRYGANVTEALSLAVSLAQHARAVQERAQLDPVAVTA